MEDNISRGLLELKFDDSEHGVSAGGYFSNTAKASGAPAEVSFKQRNTVR